MSGLSQDFLQVRKLVWDYGLICFVETGCEMGAGINEAYESGIAIVRSCDINATCVEWCRQSFPGAQISHANSIDHLTDVVPKLDGPTLFWLDAHFGPPPYDTFPLYDELEIIARLGNPLVIASSVILCDDISTVLQESLTTFDIHVSQGHATLAPYPLVKLTDLFPHHNWRVIAENTGVLEFTPHG